MPYNVGMNKDVLLAYIFGLASQLPTATAQNMPVQDLARINIAADTLPEKPVAESTGVKMTQTQKADLIFGDSLAEGMQMASGLPGYCKYGRPPREVMKAIRKYAEDHPDGLKGKNVILSSGAANNFVEMEKVLPQQLKFLHDQGVKSIVVIGVSDKQDNFYKFGDDGKKIRVPASDVNAKIEKITRQHGSVFAGAITSAGADKVHPKSKQAYKDLFDQAEKSMNKASENPANGIKPKSPQPGARSHKK